MKRWIALLLAMGMALALLTACAPGEENGPPQGEENHQPEKPGGEDDQTRPEEPDGGEEQTQPEGERPLYIFVSGHLVGSWADGQWVSAVSDEGDHPFTVAEILAEEGYYVYNQTDTTKNIPGENYLMQCEFYTYNRDQGLGGFLDEARDTAALLDPYAAFVPEEAWDKRTFALPTALTGEAAELLVPNYSFSLSFGGSYPDLAVSRRIEASYVYWRTADSESSYHPLAAEALSSRGLTGPYTLQTAELDDGAAVLVINNDNTAPGYWDGGPNSGPEGGKYFNLVLYRQADGTVETVYENITDYDGMTDTTRILPLGAWDLNGDGTVELCLDDGRWEWGFVYVMARNEDGTWQKVLQADFGM